MKNKCVLWKWDHKKFGDVQLVVLHHRVIEDESYALLSGFVLQE